MLELLLSLSLAGSGAFLLWLALYALTRDRLSAVWHGRALHLCLLFYLVPVGPALRAVLSAVPRPAAAPMPPVTAPLPTAAPSVLPMPPILSGTASPLPAVEPGFALSAGSAGLLVLVWLAGAAVLLAIHLARYRRFRGRLLQSSWEAPPETRALLQACGERLGVRRTAAVRVSPLVRTSLVMGLARPVIVLPDGPLSAGDLRYILLHELTHVQHHDLWVRRAGLLVRALHWWNPLTYLLGRQLEQLSEQACDERVAAPLTRAERYAYGAVLLSAAGETGAPQGWAATLSTRDALQRRLLHMLHVKKTSARQTALCLCLTAAVLTCGAAVALAAKAPPVADPTPVGDVAPEPARTPDAAPKAESLPLPAPAGNELVPADTSPKPSEAPREAVPEDTEPQLPYYIDWSGQPVYYAETPEELAAMREQAEAAGLLIDGQYPRNSRGETYGPVPLAPVTGREPDLCAAIGTQGESGYIRWADDPAAVANTQVRSPEDAQAYMAYLKTLPSSYTIPLYDAEGNVIGAFPRGNGGETGITTGMSVDAVKRALGEDPTEAAYTERARALLATAFAFDAADAAPTISRSPGLVHLSYPGRQDALDLYTVDLDETTLFPVTVYHFRHGDRNDPAADGSDAFDEALLSEARAFVETLCGVDASGAAVRAFRYQGKVSVELALSPTQFFHVRFPAGERAPMGVLYFQDGETAQAAMDINGARQVY